MKIWDLMCREGHDNSFYLSKDLSSGPTTYPMPQGSREYENINSKPKGGPRVKVKSRHGNKNTRDAKAKHAG